MTHHRRAGSVNQRIIDALHGLSNEAIEGHTGKTRNLFYKVASPTNDMALSLVDAAALDAALIGQGKDPLFANLFADLVGSFTTGSPRGIDLERGLRRLSIEGGELNAVIDKAMEDGVLKLGERREIASEAQDVIDVATRIRDTAEPPHEIDVPAKPKEVA